VAERWGDGRLHLTGRANLQLRALPADPLSPGAVAAEVVDAVLATGLVPSRSHELVRNVMVSPQTGHAGGRADLRPVADALDAALCADRRLADLPGRFLFVLDDGRGDLVERDCDLGLVAVDDGAAQLRVGSGWGPVVALDEVAETLVGLAARFLDRRGHGPSAAWHVRELDSPLVPVEPVDARVPGECPPLPHGPVPGGRHVAAPGGALDRTTVGSWPDGEVVVTPWHGVLLPESLLPEGSAA
jgi:precorrin-3B synthase